MALRMGYGEIRTSTGGGSSIYRAAADADADAGANAMNVGDETDGYWPKICLSSSCSCCSSLRRSSSLRSRASLCLDFARFSLERLDCCSHSILASSRSMGLPSFSC